MTDFIEGWDWRSWRRRWEAREHRDFSVSPWMEFGCWWGEHVRREMERIGKGITHEFVH